MSKRIEIKRNSVTSQYYKYRNGQDSTMTVRGLKLTENDFYFIEKKSDFVSVRTYAVDRQTGQVFDKSGYQIPPDAQWFFGDLDIKSWEQLKVDLRNKIREGDFNSAVAYKERAQTIDMITGTAKRLAKAASLVRRRKFSRASRELGLTKSPKDLTKSFANNWLAYKYGWTPLYQDIYNGMVAVDRMVRPYNKGTKVQVRSVGGANESRQAVYGHQVGMPYNWAEYVNYNFASKEVRKMYCFVKATNQSLHNVDSLGILNPALVAWELVPFSFVVDWFVPVGDWVAATPPLLGVEVTDVMKVHVIENTCYVHPFYKARTNDNFRYDGFMTTNGGVAKYFSCIRSHGDIVPALPDCSMDMTVQRCITSLSLLVQKLPFFNKRH